MAKCLRPGCKSYALKDSEDGLCYFHSPTTESKRLSAQRRGGLAGNVATVEPVESLDDIRRVLGEVLSELRSKKLARDEVYRLRSIGYLAGVYIKLIDMTEIETRITRLEAIGGSANDQK